MKRKWPVLLAVLFIAAAAGIYCFRDALTVRLFPKVVLSKALGETFSQLETRYEDSPVHMLTNALDQDGCQKISMRLGTGTQFMGAVLYDLQLNTQTAPNRIYAEGSVSAGGGTMDLQLYLDEVFGAVASGDLTGGTYYGLTYDTFPEDIRSFDMLTLFAGEEVLSGWDASVSGFAENMRRSYTLPELTAEDIRAALMAALALKPKVEATEVRHGYDVSFRADGSEIAEEAEPYQNQLPMPLAELIHQLDEDDESDLQVVFCLQSKKLTAVEAAITLTGASYRIRADLSKPETLDLEVFLYDGENLDRTELTVTTESDEGTYQETVSMTRTVNGVRSQTSADYTWDLSSGDMVLDLTVNEKQYPIRLNLVGEGDSFTVICQEFDVVLSALTGKERNRPAICTLTVTPGEPLTDVPAYRNLSEWSMEDFYLLFTRLGSLVGLKLP